MLNSGRKVNAISSNFAQKLDFYIQKINVIVQKINSSSLNTLEIVIANFQIENKVGRPRFFKKIFLVADTQFKMILKIFFLKINNANISFDKKILMWRFYIINKTLPITKQIQLIDLKKFIIIALNTYIKTFIIYIAIKKKKRYQFILEKQA